MAADPGRVLFSFQGPMNEAVNPFEVLPSNTQVLHEDISISDSGVIALDSDGYVSWVSTTYAIIAMLNDVPAKQTDLRICEMVFRTSSATPANNTGCYMQFNITDNSNYWQMGVYWPSVQWFAFLQEVTAGSATTRASDFIHADVDLPSQISLQAQDFGDTVMYFVTAYETDNITDSFAYINGYTVGSRPHKSSTDIRFRFYNNPNSDLKVTSMTAMDV